MLTPNQIHAYERSLLAACEEAQHHSRSMLSVRMEELQAYIEALQAERYDLATLQHNPCVDDVTGEHAAILEPIIALLRDSQDVSDKVTLQDSYKSHLASLGLLKPLFRKDIHLNQFVSSNKVEEYEINPLGDLLARYILNQPLHD